MKALKVITLEELRKISATAGNDEFIFISDLGGIPVGTTTHLKKKKGCRTVWDDFGNNYPSWGNFMWHTMNAGYVRGLSDVKLETYLNEQIERLERMGGRKRV